jgi:hypothetical protein
MYCHFFILLDVRNQLDFIIDYTVMRDVRLRWSAMKSCYKRYELGEITTRKDYFEFFETGYWHFIKLDSGEYTKESALEHIELLSHQWYEKYKNTMTTYSTGIISFTH